MRTLLIVVTSLLLSSGTALACEGNPNCTNTACQEKKVEKKADTEADTKADTEVPVVKAEGTEVVITVTGMTCGSCSDKVTTALTSADGVNSASVSFKSGTATIQYNAKTTSPDQLVQVITSSGFNASLPE